MTGLSQTRLLTQQTDKAAPRPSRRPSTRPPTRQTDKTRHRQVGLATKMGFFTPADRINFGKFYTGITFDVWEERSVSEDMRN